MTDAGGFSPVSGFLGQGLAEHSAVLKEVGYDDVEDYGNIDDEEMGELAKMLVDKGTINV
jgi:hypothetical protein